MNAERRIKMLNLLNTIVLPTLNIITSEACMEDASKRSVTAFSIIPAERSEPNTIKLQMAAPITTNHAQPLSQWSLGGGSDGRAC